MGIALGIVVDRQICKMFFILEKHNSSSSLIDSLIIVLKTKCILSFLIFFNTAVINTTDSLQ
jgi:hypothetical protein